MTNRIQLTISVPHRERAGTLSTSPPRSRDRRDYLKQLYSYFGWAIPPQWGNPDATPAPQHSEPDATPVKKPKTTRIKVKTK